MSAGAFVLSWAHDRTLPAPDRQTTLILAQTAGSPAWSRIIIQPDFGNGTAAAFHHFYIDEDGHETFTREWKEHSQDPAQAGCVVILFAQHSGGMTPRQWESLVSRVRTLQAQYQITTRGVTLDSDAPDTPPAQRGEVEQLNRMLQTAGLVG